MLSLCALVLLAAAPPVSELSLSRSPAPPHVYVGMYLTDVSDFDLKAGRFKADLHVWVKWLGDEKKVPPLSFENAELENKEELGLESEGAWHSMQWRVQGTFRGEFPVHAFPFDRQTLPIVFGLDESAGQLVPDLGASGMSPSFSVTGWSYEPYFSARSEERLFGSDLGSVYREGKNAKLRLTTFTVELERPFGPYLIKFVLPLALLLLIALLALFLPADRLDVRSAMGITALLSCIAFHYTQAGTLPDVTYLVAADKLFLGAYVFVAGTLLVSIVAFRLHPLRPGAAESADRVGRVLLPVVALVGVVNLLVGVLSREAAPEPVVAATPHPAQPLLRVAVPALDSLGGAGALPPRRPQLVVRDADGHLQPLLAQEAPSMTNSLVRLLPNGGMRLRWRLRAGARWSDGTPLTADDLVFSLGLTPDPYRTGVERVDARTLDVTYSERHSEWLAGFAVFPKAHAAASPDGGREGFSRANNENKLPTAGAFRVTEFVKGERATFVRDEGFVGPKPAFEKIEVRVMAPLEAAKALVAGELDVLPSLTPDAYELLVKERRVKVLEQPGDMAWVLVPRLDVPPWSSLESRRALFAALDRAEMAKVFAPAPARPAFGWRAVEGYPLPLTTPLAPQVVKLRIAPVRSQDQAHALLAQRVVADLAKVGVTVEVVETPDLYQVVQRGAFEGLALLGRDTSDFTRFLNVRDVAKAAGEHYDDELVERVAAIQGSLYAERRRTLETELQEAWFRRLPVVPLVLTSRLAAVRADLEGPELGLADSLWWNVAEWHLAPKEPEAVVTP